MENEKCSSQKRRGLAVLTVSGWLLVLPAAIFLASAVLRALQPAQYQPARISWVIFDWITTHISRIGAAVLLVVMPTIVIILGGMTLFLLWHKDPALRQDAKSAWDIVRRRMMVGLLTTATVLAGAIFMAAVLHITAD